MYIPDFWCGVLACIAVEFVVIITAALLISTKPSKNDKEDK